MKYSSVSSRSYRNSSPSASVLPSQRYEHTRRKTQWSQSSYLYPYQYDYLNAGEEAFRNRAQLILQLEEQKIYNRRSNVIIQELLQEKKKREREERSASRLARQAAYQRELELRRQRNQMKTSKLLQQYRSNSHYKEAPKQTSSSQKSPQQAQKKNKAKNEILSKLYDKSEHTPKQNKNQESPNKTQNNNKQASLVVQILKQEINFLKEQLTQKNNSIIDLQCEIVRLQKVEKLMLEMSKVDQIEEEGDSLGKEDSKRSANLQLVSKCCNVMIQSRKSNKNRFKLFKMDNFTIQGKIELPKRISYAQTVPISKPKVSQNFTQTQSQQSEIKLQLQSNIMCYSLQVGSKLGESQIDFKLSTSGPLQQSKSENERARKQSAEIEKIEIGSQTESKPVENGESQTSQNYYDYIQNTYLEWMFEKDYKQIQQKKKKQQKN